MNDQNLETMGKSFYEFLASGANLIPLIFSIMGLAICIKTGINIWRLVDRGDAMNAHSADQSIFHQLLAFGFGALLGISAVVTYALSSIWV